MTPTNPAELVDWLRARGKSGPCLVSTRDDGTVQELRWEYAVAGLIVFSVRGNASLIALDILKDHHLEFDASGFVANCKDADGNPCVLRFDYLP